MQHLVLIRHGQSEWNLANRFTGWVDVNLTEVGADEARRAGRLLKERNLTFHRCYSSYLKRAIKTAHLVLDELDQLHIPLDKRWELNERHYGALTGMDKTAMRSQFGEAQVHEWRRSFDSAPPAQARSENSAFNDAKYTLLPAAARPDTESLKTCAERVLKFWYREARPALNGGQNVLIVAHGNSLRALVKHIEQISDTAIADFEINTGTPHFYQKPLGTLW